MHVKQFAAEVIHVRQLSGALLEQTAQTDPLKYLPAGHLSTHVLMFNMNPKVHKVQVVAVVTHFWQGARHYLHNFDTASAKYPSKQLESQVNPYK